MARESLNTLQFPIDNVNDNQVKLSTIDNSVGQTSSSYTKSCFVHYCIYITADIMRHACEDFIYMTQRLLK
jgi:hypothetical protein